MIVENKLNSYIGTVTYVKDDPNGLLKNDSLYHEAVVSVPGVFENVLAFPKRPNLDEPKVGDLVEVYSWDPTFNSYCTYEKLKEDDFVGFRSSGKMVQINHDKIVVGVFDEETEYKDDKVPDVSKLAHLEMDKNGNILVHAAKEITIEGDSNCTITIKGNASLIVEGNVTEKVSGNVESDINGNLSVTANGSTELSCPDVTVTGGMMTVGGNAAPNGNGGWCAIPVCPLTGAIHRGDCLAGT